MRKILKRLPFIVVLSATMAAACAFSLGGCIDPDPGKPPPGETATGDGGGNGGTGGTTGGGAEPDVTAPEASADPASGSAIMATTVIAVTFSETMDTDSLALTGNLATVGQAQWNEAGDVLTLSPATVWPEGSNRDFVVDAADPAGNPLESLSLVYTVDATAPAATAALFATAEVRIAEGAYPVTFGTDHIVMVDGISLLGGYAVDNWAMRDPAVHPTVISDQGASGGAEDSPTRAIEAGNTITSATVIKGLTINGGSGDYTAGIYINGGAPTIRNNVIDGGSAVQFSHGIRGIDPTGPEIAGNTINGGASSFRSFAMKMDGGVIAAGSDFSYSVLSNSLDGGVAPNRMNAMFSYLCDVTISGNVIKGGSTALDLRAGTYMIVNNSIFGGTTSQSSGIQYSQGAAVTIVNNTIDGGAGDTLSKGITLVNSTDATIQNNVFFNTGTGGNYCLWECQSGCGGIDSRPDDVRNNTLYCGSGAYINQDAGEFAVDATALETLLGGQGTVVGGNVSLDPLFVDADGPDNDPATVADNDWRLTGGTTPCLVSQGGLDLTGIVDTDIDGNPRTPPYSMGAYEHDGACQ